MRRPAAEFAHMGWVLRQLGPRAIIYPGQQQHARAAIQWLSGEVPRERLFTRLGWSQQGDHWRYLQSGAAIDAEGTLANLQVRLPGPLEQYQARPPADRDTTINSVRASLGFLSVVPDRISIPLLMAVYRSPLGETDFSLFLVSCFVSVLQTD